MRCKLWSPFLSIYLTFILRSLLKFFYLLWNYFAKIYGSIFLQFCQIYLKLFYLFFLKIEYSFLFGPLLNQFDTTHLQYKHSCLWGLTIHTIDFADMPHYKVFHIFPSWMPFFCRCYWHSISGGNFLS
jgi:hypothetical protein